MREASAYTHTDSPAPASASKRRRETQDVPGGFTYVDKNGETGRRKIRIEYITDKSRRHITFSKRKAGIMKKVSWARRSISQAGLTLGI